MHYDVYIQIYTGSLVSIQFGILIIWLLRFSRAEILIKKLSIRTIFETIDAIFGQNIICETNLWDFIIESRFAFTTIAHVWRNEAAM